MDACQDEFHCLFYLSGKALKQKVSFLSSSLHSRPNTGSNIQTLLLLFVSKNMLQKYRTRMLITWREIFYT